MNDDQNKELEGNALQVGCRGFRDALAGRDRTGERNLFHVGVSGQTRPELVAAADDVQNAGREHLAQYLAEGQGREGRERRRLEHHRIARQERRRALRHRDQNRKVPRRDAGDDAERAIANLDAPLRVVTRHFVRQGHVRDTAEIADRGVHFSCGLLERLALLEGERPRYLRGLRLERRCAGAKRVSAFGFVAPPPRKRSLRRSHRRVEAIGRALGRATDDLFRRWIQDGERPLGELPFAVDRHRVVGHWPSL
jgi:hypothetical protein